MKKPLFVVFDGNALIHRAFHALPPLTIRRTGEMVGAVYGFASILMKVINDLQPTHYAVAFDRRAPTFRHLMYDQYKATRKETPEDLSVQFARVKELVKAFNIPIYEMDGFEADDMLGTLSTQASAQGFETVIVTGDADAMQLIKPGVKVLYPKPGGNFGAADLFGDEAVIGKFGVGPEYVADFKALKGDPSDNIPGVRGIGDKGAVKLILQFGHLEQIYEHLDEVTPPKIQTLLREQEAGARQSKVLATIVTTVPVKFDPEASHFHNYDRNKVSELFRELEFFSLLNKLPETEGVPEELHTPVKPPEPVKHDYKIISTIEALNALLERLNAVGSFAFEVETTGPNAMLSQLVGLAFSPAPGESYYIPMGHTGLSATIQLPLAEVIEKLRPVMSSKTLKIAHNGKFDMIVLAELGLHVHNFSFDTQIAGYLTGEPSLDLKPMAFNKLGIEMTPITDLIGSGAKQIPMSVVEIEKTADYSCAEADATSQLSKLLRTDLENQGLCKLFDEVEMPLVPVLIHMERSGVLIDRKILRDMSQQLAEQIKMLEGEIYLAAGQEFNINSTQQLGVVLFEKLQMEAPKKKGGGYSTAADVLENLRSADRPIIGHILDYRQLSKLKSTYIDALPALINPKTGRIHTSFNQTRTTTGRLSSSDPNLQNIPIRGEQGRLIREAFIAPEGSVLLAADYSQIDLRALAHLSQDNNLMEAFRKDEDIHTATAVQLYGVPPSQITGDMRRFAKTINFGVIYGMSEYGLEQATELSREEAGKFIHAYFEKYPGVTAYMEHSREQVRKQGFVQTLLGRKRQIPEIRSPNRVLRESAERMAINMPVQGTSADIIKIAMVNIYKEMLERGVKSKMLLQVHDELIFEVPEGELPIMKDFVPQMMAEAVKLTVPIKVDTKVGKNWGEMEK